MLLKIYKIDNEYVKEISIKVFKFILFSGQKHKDGGWFRIFNFGISWTRNPLFSVKNGHKKSLKIKNTYFKII
jgi:hypothetical protein